MSPGTGLHPDFGTVWEGAPIGIPYAVVPGDQPRVPIDFHYPGESDPGPYPIPPDAPVEGAGGPFADGDRHVLVLDPENQLLYEVYDARKDGDHWHAGREPLSLTPGRTFVLARTWLDDGTRRVPVTVTSDLACTSGAIVAVDVVNAAPRVRAGGTANVAGGALLTRLGTFADPGAVTWTGAVDRGDGPARAARSAGRARLSQKAPGPM